MFPHKFVKALVHFSSFSLNIRHPQDTQMPFWLKAWVTVSGGSMVKSNIYIYFGTSPKIKGFNFLWKKWKLFSKLSAMMDLQAFSQNLKSGRPGGMPSHEFVKALVHFSSFSPRIGHPQDTPLAKSLWTFLHHLGFSFFFCFQWKYSSFVTVYFAFMAWLC